MNPSHIVADRSRNHRNDIDGFDFDFEFQNPSRITQTHESLRSIKIERLFDHVLLANHLQIPLKAFPKCYFEVSLTVGHMSIVVMRMFHCHATIQREIGIVMRTNGDVQTLS